MKNPTALCAELFSRVGRHASAQPLVRTSTTRVKAQKNRGLARKPELVKAAGGRCVLCGYNRNLAALTFHHVGADEKSFKLDMRSLSNRRLEVIRAKVEKCILMCQNCHAELHSPHLDLADLVP